MTKSRRNINTGEKQKASHSKNDLLNGGGEGVYKPKSNFLFNIDDCQELSLFRSMEIEDLLISNNIYF